MFVRSPLNAWHFNPEFYYRSVTAHGSAMGYVFPTLIAMGFGYAITESALEKPLVGRRWAWAGFFLVAVGAGIAVTVFSAMPVFGVLVSSTLASVLVLSNYSHSLVQLFTFSILLSTAATLLPYVVSTAAWLRRGEGKGRIVAALALLYSLYALVGTGRESLLWGGALILAGLPIHAWRRWRLRAQPQPQ